MTLPPASTKAVEMDWEKEAQLDPTWIEDALISQRGTFLGDPKDDSEQTVVITGSTGFLGAHMVADLLATKNTKVHCVALRLLKGSLEERLKNLIVHAEDLEDKTAHSIYHIGCKVNHAEPYARLKRANVSSLERVLRLATRVSLKYVHFASTMFTNGAVGPLNSVEDFMADFSPDTENSGHGCTKGKWVAELILKRASAIGVPVTVHRPGYKTGTQRSGVGNFTGWFDACVVLSLHTGHFPSPAIKTDRFDVTPVDYVSRSILAIARSIESPARQ
ncbi:hypothetical protein HDU89_001553 [Geranomyces variabilis]|nr:hypothetical protein HDU89_001553 [Geranomyces variabilis]